VRGGFDDVIGSTGHDRLDGGPGDHDIASFVTTTAPLAIDLGADTVRGGERERLPGLEDALGSSGHDTLIGGPAPNRLDGGPGGDLLQASGPADHAFGGPGGDDCLGGFAALNSCGAEPGGAVVVELVRSIDSSASLVITGTGGSDSVALRKSQGRFLVNVGGAPVVPGSAEACAFAGSRLISCPGRAARAQISLGPGDDSLAMHGMPRGVDATLDGGAGVDRLIAGRGADTLYAGDDQAPDTLAGAAGDDQLFGVNTDHPRRDSGRARKFGGPGDDLLVGGQPCDGDRFVGGSGRNDSASFARVRNAGVSVRAMIGGRVADPARAAARAAG
jgi:Ca2+-binding RTX toxin-like protein